MCGVREHQNCYLLTVINLHQQHCKFQTASLLETISHTAHTQSSIHHWQWSISCNKWPGDEEKGKEVIKERRGEEGEGIRGRGEGGSKKREENEGPHGMVHSSTLPLVQSISQGFSLHEIYNNSHWPDHVTYQNQQSTYLCNSHIYRYMDRGRHYVLYLALVIFRHQDVPGS